MIFTALKRKSNQIFLKKINSENKRFEQQNNTKQVKNVLVFLDDIKLNNEVERILIETFELPSTAFEFVVYQQKSSKNNIENHIITHRDFGWFGKLKSEKLKNILTNKYDLLINYNKIDQFYTNLLVLQSNASFKVGFAHLKSGLYDLTIQCNHNEIELFTKEVKKYLKILKKI
jgi:hypothetical protein